MRARTFLYISVLCLLIAAFKAKAADNHSIEFYNASNIKLKNWSEFNPNGTTIIIEFNAGDQVPVDFSLGGNLVFSDIVDIPLIVKRHFFLKFFQGQVYYSANGTSFSSATNALSMKIKAGAVDDKMVLRVEPNGP